MKGIFSSHPHAPGEADSEPVRVRYVHTGPLVWTTFFQQHNDQHQTLVVPPGITTDVKYLTSGQEDVFHQVHDRGIRRIGFLYFIFDFFALFPLYSGI